MPLDQNCDMVEISNLATATELRFFYDDGTQLATYVPAFEWIRVDSENLRVDIRLCPEWLETKYSSENIYFEFVHIHLKNSELLFRLEKVFAFNKMISADEFF